MARTLLDSGLSLTGLERQSIQLAQTSLSFQTRSLYTDQLNSSIQEKQRLLATLDPGSLDAAIASLLKGEHLTTNMSTRLLAMLDDLRRIGAADNEHNLRDHYEQAVAADNVLDAVINLMDFRRRYLALIRDTQTDLQTLTIEKNQLEH